MIQRTSSVIVAGAVVLGALSLGGCATKKFVREEVAVVGTRVDTVATASEPDRDLLKWRR